MKSKSIIDENGNKRWKLPNGDLHREDGPAVEWWDGGKAWYLDGKLHREDGPAYQSKNGFSVWYLNGEEYTKQEYKKKMRLIKLDKIL